MTSSTKTLIRLALVVAVAVLSAMQTGAAPIRNVILCIGDGMGPEQVKAARYYAGADLFFESFPYQTTMATSSASYPTVTDSAAAATAMATGTKVNNGVISLKTPGDGSELETLLEYFKARDKATGLVTTTYITHATPAGFGAHESSRNNTTQIAADYLNQTRPNVLLGGGAYGMTVAGAQAAGYTVATDSAALHALDTESETFVSGQFGSGYMPYEYDGLGSLPHLHEMTQVALDILDNDPDGFFLMMEGGRIDHAGHANNITNVVHETLEFDKSVKTAFDWMGDREDTLILVTADHETGGLTVLADNGVSNYPSFTWLTNGHTATPVPVYSIGLNAHLATNITDNTDIPYLATSPALVPEKSITTQLDTSGFQMVWTSSSGDVYRVEYTPDLASTNWYTLATVTGTSTRLGITDSNLTDTVRSYRLVSETPFIP